MKTKFKKGDRVRVICSDGSLSEEMFEVVRCGMTIVTVTNGIEETPIHVSRCKTEGENLMPDANKDSKPKKKLAGKKMKAKPAVATKPKPLGQKVDLNALKKEGHAVWSKDITEAFNVKNQADTDVKTTAVCLISPDKKSFTHVNLFNGTIGRKPEGTIVRRKTKGGEVKESEKSFGNTYQLKDEKAYDNKIKKLKKQGYKQK